MSETFVVAILQWGMLEGDVPSRNPSQQKSKSLPGGGSCLLSGHSRQRPRTVGWTDDCSKLKEQRQMVATSGESKMAARPLSVLTPCPNAST